MGKFTKPRCIRNFRGTSYHGRKTIFSFSGRPEKMVFQKHSRWNMIFLVLLVKIISLFFENISYPLDGKWRMNFFNKTHGNMIFSSGVLKDDLFKKTTPEHEISCIIWKDGICFCGNTIFSLDRKWKMIFLKKYSETRYFLPTCRR